MNLIITATFKVADQNWFYLRGGFTSLQYSTLQYSTLQYSTLQYSTLQYSTLQYYCNWLCIPNSGNLRPPGESEFPLKKCQSHLTSILDSALMLIAILIYRFQLIHLGPLKAKIKKTHTCLFLDAMCCHVLFCQNDSDS